MQINQAVLYQMAIAFGIAVLGIAGIYSTVRPDLDTSPHAISVITASIADQAGATVSLTR